MAFGSVAKGWIVPYVCVVDLDELFLAARASGSLRQHEQLLYAVRHVLMRDLRREVPSATLEDVVQEALLIIERKLPEFVPRRRGSFQAWVVKIGRTHARHCKRRGKLVIGDHEPLPDSSPEPSTGPITALRRAEQRSELRRLLDRLATVYRRTLQLKLAGLDNHEIASAEGITVKAVQSRLARLCHSAPIKRAIARLAS